MYSVEPNSGKKLVVGELMAQDVRPIRSAKATRSGIMMLAALLLLAAPLIQAQTEAVLYNFTGTPDGANPTSRLTLNNGNLYGTTYYGGAYGNGSVFELSPSGSGWTEKILYSFCPASPSCTDGANPAYSFVTFDSKGNMYGTAYNGGSHGDGIVFELTPSGSTWNEVVLYSFADTPDGANPINGVIFDKKGNLLGTTYSGGSNGGNGTVYELTPSGNNWTETPVVNINSNGAGLTLASSGYVYGTSYSSVFVMLPTASGYETIVIYTFNPANAAKVGSDPMGTVAVDSAGNVYGTTVTGGTYSEGVIYKLTEAVKGGPFKEQILAEFGTKIGASPNAGVVLDSAGNLYGTAEAGGRYNAGTVYKLTPTGSGTYTSSTLATFSGINGAGPVDGLVQDVSGYLYGTTYVGGNKGYGTVFTVNPKANVTTVTITSSLNPSVYGDAVMFTATVTSPAGPPPNGEYVVFEPIGQAPMTNGVATFTLSDLSPGTTKITAVYEGDLNFITSNASLEQVVNK